MSREVSDWLSGYLKYTENSEPPLSYHTWVGLSLIGAALQRKCVLRWGFEEIYPNIYVVLIGASGKTRKGTALGIGKSMLSDTSGVNLVAEATTQQALVRTMMDSLATYNVPGTGKVRSHCSVAVFSEELSVFLGQNDIRFLAHLTDWYDSKDRWAYDTIGRGKEYIQGVCCTLIGATAPDWLQSMLPQEAVGGGFTSRIIFVVEEKKRRTVAKHIQTAAEVNLRKALINDLARINNLVGDFKFDREGESLYTSWYERYDKELEAGNYPISDPKFASYCERRSTHVRKIAMILSASRGDSLVITAADIHRAMELLERVERKMHKTFGGLGKSKTAVETYKILEYVQNMRIVSRSDLLRKFHSDLDIADFKSVEDMMVQMRVVQVEILPGGDKLYRWMDKADSKKPASAKKVRG